MTVSELYKDALESLPPRERLRLAKMLLDTVSPAAVIDENDEWTDEDLREYSAYSRRRMDARLSAEETDASKAG